MSNYREVHQDFVRGVFTKSGAQIGSQNEQGHGEVSPSSPLNSSATIHPSSSLGRSGAFDTSNSQSVSSISPSHLTSHTDGSWRDRAEKSIHIRRMTPSQTATKIAKLQQKGEAIQKVIIPHFPEVRKVQASSLALSIRRDPGAASSLAPSSSSSATLPTDTEKDDAISSGLSASISARPSPPATKPTTSFTRRTLTSRTTSSSPTREETKSGLSSTSSPLTPYKISYNLHFPDPKVLAVSERVVLDALPLEMFDVEEHDLTPQQWIALGADKVRNLL